MNDTLAILGHYLRAKYRPHAKTRGQLERRQERRFAQLSRDVLVHSPFYRSYAGKPLGEYPFADKALAYDAFDRINTRGLKRDELIALALSSESSRDFSATLGEIAVGLSSGTSGRRGLFVTSRQERRRYAGAVLAKGLRGSLLRGRRVALLLRANNPLYEAVNRSRRIQFGFFDLLAPFERNLAALEAFAPNVLIGPPQALRLVADAVASGRIRLGPEQIVAGAEVLERADALAIEAAFGVQLDQIYQATEGFLGITCHRGTLHLNEDGIIFERHVIDRASGRFMPIVTDLWRSTQPVVRYRLDDVLVERSEACPCGSVFAAIARIEGRADDILLLPRIDGDALVPVMPDFVRDGLALVHDRVADYRVIQHDPGEIEVLVQGPSTEAARSTALEVLARVFAAAHVRMPSVRFGATIPRDLSRKLRRVERRFTPAQTSNPCAF
jgi:putative adenylate-forming enzyme